MLGADMSSSAYVDNRNKDTLILDEGPTQGVDSTAWTTEAKTSINFTQSNRKFCFKFTLSWEQQFFYLLMVQR